MKNPARHHHQHHNRDAEHPVASKEKIDSSKWTRAVHKSRFLIVAYAVFLLIHQINRLKSQEKAPPGEPITNECPS
jgi:large-conductance mechanosensitive channel